MSTCDPADFTLLPKQKTCAGSAIFDPNDALFSDDTGTFNDLPLPCAFSISSFAPPTNAVHAALRFPMFVNTLGAGLSALAQVAYENAPNVIGAECEECYASDSGVPVTGANWQNTENAEIQTIAAKRIFWAYPRPIGDAASETALRTFLFSSFLLTYDPLYAMFEEAFSTPHGFPVDARTGFGTGRSANDCIQRDGVSSGRRYIHARIRALLLPRFSSWKVRCRSQRR